MPGYKQIDHNKITKDLEQSLNNWQVPVKGKKPRVLLYNFSIPEAYVTAYVIGKNLEQEKKELAEEQERKAALDLLDDLIEACKDYKLPVPDYVAKSYDHVARVYKKGRKSHYLFVDYNDEDLFEAKKDQKKVIWKIIEKYR